MRQGEVASKGKWQGRAQGGVSAPRPLILPDPGQRFADTAARLDAELRQDYQRLKIRRGSGVAKVAIARKLAVRMYWMLRSPASYAQLVRMQGSPWATLVEDSPSLG